MRGDKENATLDSGELSNLTAKSKQTAKKSRSKSLGPGGIDALKEGTGNNGRACCTITPFPSCLLIFLKATFASDEIDTQAFDTSFAL